MNNAEIIERAIENLRKFQRLMLIAKEENAVKTYNELKEEYIAAKALLNSLGVNLSEVDKIKG